MTDRDRLIKLLQEPPADWEGNRGVGAIADHLLANGVIVPPCKVGDTVYEIEYGIGSYELWEKNLCKTEVKAICILTENDYHPLNRIGKDVFLTKEDGEQVLKEREEE